MISVRTLSKRHGDARGPARASAPTSTTRRDDRDRRPVGRRQVDAAALPQLPRDVRRAARSRSPASSCARAWRGGDARRCASCARSVGMVFQQFNLFPHLTALDNITLAPRVVRRARAPARRDARAASCSRGSASAIARGAYPARALGRPAAARRDRARARAGARGAAVRRADQRARSRDARRGDGGDQGPRDAAA